MAATDSNRSPEHDGTSGEPGWAATVFASPVLWGGLLTVGFYQLIPVLPVQRELAERYFCSHPLEYATALLFFVGMAILGLKGFRMFAERRALTETPIDLDALRRIPEPDRRVTELASQLAAAPPAVRSSGLGRRLRDIVTWLRGQQSREGLEEHLKYLAEIAGERMHDSYALVRTITWAVPILGFLGTVIGITLAIANVTPEQLDTSLGEVTGGLAVAFDTTALALGLSLVLVFTSFLIERFEQGILNEIEEFGIRRLLGLFPASPHGGHSLSDVQSQASQHLLEKTESLITWQTQLWQESLESLRSRWTQSLETQQQELDAALQAGMQATLDDHARQLEAVRGEFLTAFRESADELRAGLAETRADQKSLLETAQAQLEQLWSTARSDLATLQSDQAERASELLATLTDAVSGWQQELRQSSEAGIAQSEELRQQRELLARIVESEEGLARLQGSLKDNLEALRGLEAFDETLHSLTAAVHLLTARARPKAA